MNPNEYGTITQPGGIRVTYGIAPHPKGGFRAQRMVGAETMDYSVHKTETDAVAATIRSHDFDLRIGGGTTTARQ